jgi:hypothetical protein
VRLVEGADLRHLGRTLAQQLVGGGELVVDAPTKLAARVRLVSAGHGRKIDPDDAVSVVVAAHGAGRLGQAVRGRPARPPAANCSIATRAIAAHSGDWAGGRDGTPGGSTWRLDDGGTAVMG